MNVAPAPEVGIAVRVGTTIPLTWIRAIVAEVHVSPGRGVIGLVAGGQGVIIAVLARTRTGGTVMRLIFTMPPPVLARCPLMTALSRTAEFGGTITMIIIMTITDVIGTHLCQIMNHPLPPPLAMDREYVRGRDGDESTVSISRPTPALEMAKSMGGMEIGQGVVSDHLSSVSHRSRVQTASSPFVT